MVPTWEDKIIGLTIIIISLYICICIICISSHVVYLKYTQFLLSIKNKQKNSSITICISIILFSSSHWKAMRSYKHVGKWSTQTHTLSTRSRIHWHSRNKRPSAEPAHVKLLCATSAYTKSVLEHMISGRKKRKRKEKDFQEQIIRETFIAYYVLLLEIFFQSLTFSW